MWRREFEYVLAYHLFIHIAQSMLRWANRKIQFHICITWWPKWLVYCFKFNAFCICSILHRFFFIIIFNIRIIIFSCNINLMCFFFLLFRHWLFFFGQHYVCLSFLLFIVYGCPISRGKNPIQFSLSLAISLCALLYFSSSAHVRAFVKHLPIL